MYSFEELLKIGQYYSDAHNGSNIANNQLTFMDGFVPTAEEMELALLTTAKKSATAEIDSQYESKRQTYLTSGSTMAMVYLLKAAEAKLYKADPNSGSFPFLTASVEAGEAESLGQAADRVLGLQGALIQIAANLEKERLSKKIAVANATTVAEVETILTT